MNVAAVIKLMRAKGMSDTDILDVVQAGLDGERARSAAAERQARYRERKACDVTSDVTRDVTTPSPLVPPALSPEPPNPPPYNPPNPILRPKRVRTDAGADFDDFWKAYPTDPLMSKKRAAGEWVKLDAEDRGKARRACDPFRDYCASHPDYRPVHAERFLSQRRFDGFQPTTSPTATGPPEGVPVFATDEEFQEWWAKRRGVA